MSESIAKPNNPTLLIVLVALLAITATAWVVSTFNLLSGTQLGIALIVLAFIKARLIIRHYMEVAEAILPVRIAFDVWLLAAAAGTLLFYLPYLP